MRNSARRLGDNFIAINPLINSSTIYGRHNGDRWLAVMVTIMVTVMVIIMVTIATH